MMQAHTKKRPTETIELRFIGPVVNMARAIETLKRLGQTLNISYRVFL